MDSPLVAAQRHAKHVRHNLAGYTLGFKLPREVEEDLVRQVRQRRTDPGCCRECAMSTVVCRMIESMRILVSMS